MKKLLQVLALLCLASCGTNSTSSVVAPKPRSATIPGGLKQQCREPVELPERDLDSIETVSLWAEDRAALGECGLRHKALTDATNELEKQGD